MRGPPNSAEWHTVSAVAVMFSTQQEWREHRPDARSEFQAQWAVIERLLLAHGHKHFHALFMMDDTKQFELEYILYQCRRNGTPLVVADAALLPWGADMSGVRLLHPASRDKAPCR
jgi:hypothetical protein